MAGHVEWEEGETGRVWGGLHVVGGGGGQKGPVRGWIKWERGRQEDRNTEVGPIIECALDQQNPRTGLILSSGHGSHQQQREGCTAGMRSDPHGRCSSNKGSAFDLLMVLCIPSWKSTAMLQSIVLSCIQMRRGDNGRAEVRKEGVRKGKEGGRWERVGDHIGGRQRRQARWGVTREGSAREVREGRHVIGS